MSDHKRYDVHFTLGRMKLKGTVKAENENHAKALVWEQLLFTKVVEIVETDEPSIGPDDRTIWDGFDAMFEGVDQLTKNIDRLFGDRKKKPAKG